MSELLNQLDGFDTHGDVKVIVAANKIESLDPALICPSRIDREIEFRLPDVKTKRHIFRLHTSRTSLSNDVDLKELVMTKDDLSDADIKAVCTEAGVLALRERHMRDNKADFTSVREKVLFTKNEAVPPGTLELEPNRIRGQDKPGFSLGICVRGYKTCPTFHCVPSWLIRVDNLAHPALREPLIDSPHLKAWVISIIDIELTNDQTMNPTILQAVMRSEVEMLRGVFRKWVSAAQLPVLVLLLRHRMSFKWTTVQTQQNVPAPEQPLATSSADTSAPPPQQPGASTPRAAPAIADVLPGKNRQNSYIFLILVALGLVFSKLPGNLLGGEKLPRQLPTVFSRFDLTDTFKRHPICYLCHKIFDPAVPPDTLCPDCECEIFRPQTRTLFRRLFQSEPEPTVSGDSDPETDSAGSTLGRQPHVVAPIQVLSDSLRHLFARPGMVPAVNGWKAQEHSPNELRSIQDGEVWNTITGPDKKRFFFEGDSEKEIRLGVTFSLDWFGRKTSNYGPSHSSGVMSYCVQNFENSLRYRAENLILGPMPPGPSEQTSEQLQHYLKIVVDDLIMLYDHGIIINPPEHPNGIRLRVALIAIIADHPAMCKLCGFADHRHNEAPCTKCDVPRDERFSEKALRNEYRRRTGDEHRKLCFEYSTLTTDEERTEFFATHGVRWTEFARLKYFDIVRYTVIDPMHNLLLGVAKTQWYNQWIQTNALRADTKRKNRELHLIHDFLETFEAPLWAGRLPLRVGEPAGGSLTADEYKFAVTSPWAILIPMVWDTFIGDAKKDQAAALAKYATAKGEWEKEIRRRAQSRSKSKGTAPEEPQVPSPRMRDGEDENFLAFATALKILVGSAIRIEKIHRAEALLQQYLLGFARIYGTEQMKPNHHWAVHIPDQIRDFGPVYSFWAFLTERLNKILKNLNSNNWTGGRLEESMMREFHRSAALDGVIKNLLADPTCTTLERQFIQRLGGERNKQEALGTIQDALRDEQTLMRVKAGSIADKAEKLDDLIRQGLEYYYNKDQPQVHYLLAVNPSPNTSTLASHAETYNFALLDGRRITPTSRSERNTAGSSIVQARINNKRHAGEIRSIFVHRQPGVQGSSETVLAAVAWMKRSEHTPLENPKFVWDQL
ncbi:hypothetical protein DFH08DRAFT_825153 [Mycena albidolilacea]|uniref:ATPase AAA-type core domain-containing protein n=1 Tax=Mycena albidolilacea TaxID=1033008 RepID=A0AAD6Z2P9_9AGAR|nr:hypothetical protein DFH08DRAFT_825153 [Mycena albidolilacea]